ncbi:uncharacterized protein [Amphiura filiformis]|uniref:uncharacterized protein n=1 Tax=Amphiura filiformis TaxID=82378 RepID=UPI003B2272EE
MDSRETLWGLGPGPSYDHPSSAPASIEHGIDQYFDQYPTNHDQYPIDEDQYHDDDDTWDKAPSEASQSTYSQDFSTTSWDEVQNSAPPYTDPSFDAPNKYQHYYDTQTKSSNGHDNSHYNEWNDEVDSQNLYDKSSQKFDDYQTHDNDSTYDSMRPGAASSSYTSNTTWNDDDDDFQGYPEWDIQEASLANFDRHLSLQNRSLSEPKPHQYSTMSLPRNFQYQASFPPVHSQPMSASAYSSPQRGTGRNQEYYAEPVTHLRYAFSSGQLYPDAAAKRPHARGSYESDQYFGLMPDSRQSQIGDSYNRSQSVPPFVYDDNTQSQPPHHDEVSNRKDPPPYESLDLSKRQVRPQSAKSLDTKPIESTKMVRSAKPPQYGSQTLHKRGVDKRQQFAHLSKSLDNLQNKKPTMPSRYSNQNASSSDLNRSPPVSTISMAPYGSLVLLAARVNEPRPG